MTRPNGSTVTPPPLRERRSRPPAGEKRGGLGANLADRREASAAFKLLSGFAGSTSLLWLPCRDPSLFDLMPPELAARVFLADYRGSRLRALVDALPEARRGSYRARRVAAPLFDWDDAAVDLTWLPGVLSRLAVPADRRLMLSGLAGVSRRAICVSARVAKSARGGARAGFSGLGPDQAIQEVALLEDFAAVGLEVVERRTVFGLSERKIYLLGPVEEAETEADPAR